MGVRPWLRTPPRTPLRERGASAKPRLQPWSPPPSYPGWRCFPR